MEPEREPSSFSQKLFWLHGLVYTLFFSLIALSKRHHQTHRNPPQHNPNDASSRSENIPSGPVRVVIDSFPPPPPPTDEQKAKEKRKKRFEIGKIVLEVLALVGLFLYVCETKRTNDLTQQALDTGKANFAKDQRPYMWPAKIVPLPLKPGEFIMARVYFVNYGKTPAIRVNGGGEVLTFYGQEVMKQADTWFENFSEDKTGGGSKIIVPPGIPTDPTQSNYIITPRSRLKPANQSSVDTMNQTDGSFAVVGIITYFDSEGTSYRSDYCVRYSAARTTPTEVTGRMEWCQRHNEIH